MSLLETPDRRFDQRTLEYKIQTGNLDVKECKQYLEKLPDEEGNYEVLDLGEKESVDSENPA